MDQTDLKVTTVLSESTLNYSKIIGKHEIAAVAGVEFQQTSFNGTRLIEL